MINAVTSGDVHTIVEEGLGNASYLVDVGDGRALIIDPVRDPRPYLEEARRRGLQIAFAAETHLHNDFVSGSNELMALGATVVASADASLAFPHRAMHDGDEVDLGGLTLQCLATPGHTPEHLSYVLLDDSRPLAVFTGGALLRGSVGRTDLLGPDQTEPLTRALYRSVRERLFTLPDDLTVHPTHGAGGSFCAAVPTSEGDPTTTIGREKGANALFRSPDEDGFAKLLLGSYSSYPQYFRRLREVNRKGPRVYGVVLPGLHALPSGEVRRLRDEGAELIDVRPVEEFAAGHIPGALSNALRPAFATWLGSLVPEDRPLVFVLAERQDRNDLVRQCLNIGYERLAGELEGGMATWREAGLPEKGLPLVHPEDTTGATLVDVRQRAEFDAGHIPNAWHVELGDFGTREVSLPDRPLTLLCGHGERSMTAASLLERIGREDISVLLGGPQDWSSASGKPLELSDPD
jgi:glyoxylase-like metal-dependent hydrolase (beta-lactamase superfamily II)/rhodanese-related sulfurtransferase